MMQYYKELCLQAPSMIFFLFSSEVLFYMGFFFTQTKICFTEINEKNFKIHNCEDINISLFLLSHTTKISIHK